MHYTALIDGKPGAWGVSFPDLPGCTAMGATLQEARANAVDALRGWAEAMRAHGSAIPPARSLDQLVDDPEFQEARAESEMAIEVVLLSNVGRPVRANMSLDSGVLAAIDATADRVGLTRSGFIERLALDHIPDYS